MTGRLHQLWLAYEKNVIDKMVPVPGEAERWALRLAYWGGMHDLYSTMPEWANSAEKLGFTYDNVLEMVTSEMNAFRDYVEAQGDIHRSFGAVQ